MRRWRGVAALCAAGSLFAASGVSASEAPLVLPLAGVETSARLPLPVVSAQAWPGGARRLAGQCVTHLSDGTILVCEGRRLLALGADGMMRRWGGTLAGEAAGYLIDADVASDGSVLALGFEGVVRVRPDGTASLLSGLDTDLELAAITALPDGGAVVAGSWRRGHVLEISSGGAIRVLVRRIPRYGSPYLPSSDVTALPDGSIALAAAERVLSVERDGTFSVLVGGDQPFVDGNVGRGADIGYVDALAPAPGAALVIAADVGLIVLGADGRIRRVSGPPPRPGRASARAVGTDGRPAADVALDPVERLDALSHGPILALLGRPGRTDTRLVAIAAREAAPRLSITLPATNRVLLRSGTVSVLSTAAASGTLRFFDGRRPIESMPVTVGAGVTELDVPASRGDRTLMARIELRDDAGRVAIHHLTFIAGTRLGRQVFARLRHRLERGRNSGTYAWVLRRCQRRSRTAYSCTWRSFDDLARTQSGSARFRLRSDGLVEYHERTRRGRTIVHEALEPL